MVGYWKIGFPEQAAMHACIQLVRGLYKRGHGATYMRMVVCVLLPVVCVTVGFARFVRG